jgi:hypothetical protein
MELQEVELLQATAASDNHKACQSINKIKSGKE